MSGGDRLTKTPASHAGDGGANPTSPLQMAWQAQIKERVRAEENDLFGRWWESLDLSIDKARVREVSYATAAATIERYEWLGTMPAIARYCYGIYFDGACGGVVVYGDEYSENLGVWDSYGYTGRIVLLARGAVTHWAPKNTGSRLIRVSMRLLPPKYEVVTATVDARAGEVGTIYQACGFDYIGRMNTHHRTLVRLNGKEIGSRALRGRFGHSRGDDLRGMGLITEREAAKARYFAFRGANRDNLRQSIAALIRPYPKRAALAGVRA